MNKWEKKLTVIFLLLSAAVLLAACRADSPVQGTEKEEPSISMKALAAPEILNLNAAETRLAVGATEVLDLLDENGNDCSELAEWISSDPEVVSVDGGEITANTVGTAEIYARFGDIVSNKVLLSVEIFISSVDIDTEHIELLVGNTAPIGATPLPENATDKSLSWQSSNPSVAYIQGNQAIGKGVGSCTFSVFDSRGTKHGEISVTVQPVLVSKISIQSPVSNLAVGQKSIVNASVAPENATNRGITWSSSNPGVLTVSEDGIITAVGSGSAAIRCASNDGAVTAESSVNITASSSAALYYATEKVALRRAPSSKASILGYAGQDNECAALYSADGWYLINCGSTVGYAPASAFSSTRPVRISGVPYINQFDLGLYTGCEAVSATMLLRYYGYNVTSEQMVAATPSGAPKHEENGVWIGANPFEAFVGDPHKKLNEGSWGVFAKPIVKAMNQFCGGRAKEISGCSEEQIYQYLLAGKPVVIWCTAGGQDIEAGVTWRFPDGSGIFQELVHQHCAVLIGMDSKYVYLNDPSRGQNSRQLKSVFFANWRILYSQAIIIQ